eukprot:TRINITY_DN14093_c0_g2_i1.p1 TRINITY_DN14093_c0_g2~~TRINITY_DN14093_c0_g2_i1.p1  ORF type:complete len:218 (+),score=57.80 TRINITY_DN14093_c0_g2_i1:43-696(+)
MNRTEKKNSSNVSDSGEDEKEVTHKKRPHQEIEPDDPQSKKKIKTEPESQTSPKNEEPTNTLFIKNFVRPFHNSALTNMLNTYGKVTDFWMNHIKSFCFVTYSTVEDAVNARNNVNSIIWPPTNKGLPLVVEYVTYEESQERKQSNEMPVVPPAPSAHTPMASLAPPKTDKTVDELFKKTKVEPHIYYLPLTLEEVNSKLEKLGKPPITFPTETQTT